jgi:hydroxyethylthiazole kinase-like uncharacterized protein yjeF
MQDENQLLDWRDRALPLFNVADHRRIEDEARRALGANELMARAGRAAACFLLSRLAEAPAHTRRVWIAAGPGNNGGDALVMARELAAAGASVQVTLVEPARRGEAVWALEQARQAGVSIDSGLPVAASDAAWGIDGLFGIGAQRAVEGRWAALVSQLHAMRDARRGILALDVPTGLDAQTGMPIGEMPPVRATDTIAFLGAKPGLFTGEGRDCAGRILIAPLGLDAATIAPDRSAARLNAPETFAPALPRRKNASHKGTFGSIAVVGGATGMCGAAVLSARASLYAGAGKVHVALLGADRPAYDGQHPELMLHALDTLDLAPMNGIVVGPGLGQADAATAAIERVLDAARPTVIDADALNAISSSAGLAARVASHRAPVILTPHPLEAARLVGCDTQAVSRARLAVAQALSRRFAATVVLKGAGTVIASPDDGPAVNPTGNAGLATGGTGDVLTGLIGALLAQHVPARDAALAGVYLHGLAAESLAARGVGPAGLTAGEIAPEFRALLNRLLAG